MKMFIVLAALVAVALAAPQQRHQLHGGEVHVVKETLHDNIGLSDYKYNYELSDGSRRDEVAHVETLRAARSGEEPTAVLRVQGSFSYVAPDGQTYTVNYVADENGFQPQGAHLPVA